jgi:serine/threonine-protein kinase RIM15
MPVLGGRNTGAVSTLSSSASMISPLNPLPSPWASGSSDASSAFSPASVVSDTSATTPSSGGAIRLNRVPTSVRLAAELIKQPSAGTSPQIQTIGLHHNTPSSSSGTGPGTPSGTPAEGSQSSEGSRTNRDLGAASSMPPPALPHSKPPFNIGKGRPTLSVPATPSSTRNHSFADKAPASTVEPGPPRRIPSSGSLAPPTSFKAPAGQMPKLRPSAPPQTDSSPASTSAAAQAKTHRYRTSMHEASFQSGFARTASANWPPAQSQTTPSTAILPPGLGLGLDMPQTAIRLTDDESVDPAAPSQEPGAPRMRSVTGQDYAMDLAGIGSMGDAASHASMIMQSRQAKLQRWRPTSSGTTVSDSMALFSYADNTDWAGGKTPTSRIQPINHCRLTCHALCTAGYSTGTMGSSTQIRFAYRCLVSWRRLTACTDDHAFRLGLSGG